MQGLREGKDMIDASHNSTKFIIAAAIYLMVAIMVAAGLTLRGASVLAENEGVAPAGYQQAGLHDSGTGAVREQAERSVQPADDGRFEVVDAKMLLEPTVQAIILSSTHIVF